MQPGYQQTEVGMIPADWHVVPLGQRLRRAPSYGINAPAIPLDSRFPTYLRITDITDDGRFDEATKVSVDHPSSAAYLLELGDLVLARTGATVGKSYLYDSNDGPLVFAGFLIRVSPDPEQLVPAFLSFFTQSRPYWNWVKVNSMRSGQPGINGREYASLPIPVPPTKAEQEAIAEALSDADVLIESLEQLLAKKRQIKQGAMQELLTGKRRLPGFEVKPGYKPTEMGVVPTDWEVAPLGQRLRRTPSYGINAPAVPFDLRLPTYLRITDITEEGRFAEATKVSVDHPASAAYLLERGDVVLARTGASVGKSYLYDPTDGPLVFAGFLIRVSPDPERLVPAFLSFFLQTRPYWNWVTVNSMRSGQPGVNGQEYAALPVPLPPAKAEQEAIAAILSDMDVEIAMLGTKLAKTRALKQGMMQELLTGKTRLVAAPGKETP